MKVKLSSLWRRSGRKAASAEQAPDRPTEVTSTPAPAEAPTKSAWKHALKTQPPPAKPAAAPNWPPPGTAAMAWMGETGKPRPSAPQVKRRSEDEVELELREPVTAEQTVWVVLDDGSAHAGVIGDCSEEQGHFRASVRLIPDPPASSTNGEAPAATRVKWVNSSGEIVRSSASLRNSEAGQLQLSLTEPVPVSSLVLVSAASFQCLGSTTGTEQEGDRWLAEVEVLGDAFSTPRPRAT